MLMIAPEDQRQIVNILAERAASHPDDPQTYFRSLIEGTNLPRWWIVELSGSWGRDPIAAARRLVRWCLVREVNPADRRFTTLGSILQALLGDEITGERESLEASYTMVAIIIAYGLYRDSGLLQKLIDVYPVPSEVSEGSVGDISTLPPETWRTPINELELQRFLPPRVVELSVGHMKSAMICAASVCRIEGHTGGPLGTGFLIDRRLVLTRSHILTPSGSKDVRRDLSDIVIRFGLFGDSTANSGQFFHLDQDRPIVYESPVNLLDYIVFQLEAEITRVNVAPLEVRSDVEIHKGAELNLIHHPGRESMKLALTRDAVTAVDEKQGMVQYVTSTSGGSSGAPCFNLNWQPVAMHRGELARTFGSVREGTLLQTIYADFRRAATR